MAAPSPGDDRVLFERLQSLLLGVGNIDRVLTELAQVSTTVVTAPVSCGITMRYDGALLTVGSSDSRAELLDETQYRVGGGPCLQSLQDGEIVNVVDTHTEQRWPAYTAVAVGSGLRCSVSLPLTVSGDTFGAMNVYGFEEPDLFGPEPLHQLELFAAQAAGTLRVATRQAKDTTLLAQMEESLRSRTVIDQAMGIIMAQQRCTSSVAFELLRRESQNSRHRLRDVAADLVTRVSGQEPEVGRGFDRPEA